MEHEPTFGPPGQEAVIAGIDWSKTHHLASHPAVARDRAGKLEPPAREGEAPIERSWDATADFVHLDDFVLPKHHFLREMHRERRRADRSKSPLSIAFFRFEGNQGDKLRHAAGLLEILRNNKRETDILGDLDRTFAMILLDTNPEGLKQFVARIAKYVNELRFSIATGTYPHDLFDELLRHDGEVGRSHPLFVDRRREPGGLGLLLKRWIDVVVAGPALVLLSPLMLIVAAAIASTSPGPVIFTQVRLGKGGRPFVFYKFRSMIADSDDRIHREYVTGLIRGNQQGAAGESAPKWSKLKSDPRITPVGHFIRKTSIDELPQLFNVLRGDLSLIGPRPALPYEAEKYESWHLRRILEIKPGVSGLWQVAAGYDATFEDMVRLDLRYIRDWSLMLDLKILVKTVQVVLRRNGAG